MRSTAYNKLFSLFVYFSNFLQCYFIHTLFHLWVIFASGIPAAGLGKIFQERVRICWLHRRGGGGPGGFEPMPAPYIHT
jgi:hypothetical protein